MMLTSLIRLLFTWSKWRWNVKTKLKRYLCLTNTTKQWMRPMCDLGFERDWNNWESQDTKNRRTQHFLSTVCISYLLACSTRISIIGVMNGHSGQQRQFCANPNSSLVKGANVQQRTADICPVWPWSVSNLIPVMPLCSSMQELNHWIPGTQGDVWTGLRAQRDCISQSDFHTVAENHTTHQVLVSETSQRDHSHAKMFASYLPGKTKSQCRLSCVKQNFDREWRAASHSEMVTLCRDTVWGAVNIGVPRKMKHWWMMRSIACCDVFSKQPWFHVHGEVSVGRWKAERSDLKVVVVVQAEKITYGRSRQRSPELSLSCWWHKFGKVLQVLCGGKKLNFCVLFWCLACTDCDRCRWSQSPDFMCG